MSEKIVPRSNEYASNLDDATLANEIELMRATEAGLKELVADLDAEAKRRRPKTRRFKNSLLAELVTVRYARIVLEQEQDSRTRRASAGPSDTAPTRAARVLPFTTDAIRH
jgi:hypothetical protein